MGGSLKLALGDQIQSPLLDQLDVSCPGAALQITRPWKCGWSSIFDLQQRHYPDYPYIGRTSQGFRYPDNADRQHVFAEVGQLLCAAVGSRERHAHLWGHDGPSAQGTSVRHIWHIHLTKSDFQYEYGDGRRKRIEPQ